MRISCGRPHHISTMKAMLDTPQRQIDGHGVDRTGSEPRAVASLDGMPDRVCQRFAWNPAYRARAESAGHGSGETPTCRSGPPAGGGSGKPTGLPAVGSPARNLDHNTD